MRMSMKLTAAMTAAAAALLMTACSGSSADTAGSGAAESGSSAGPVNLTYWAWAPNIDKVVATWNAANPDIQVTVNKQDGGDPAVTKLLTATKAGSGAPDLMQAEYQKIPTLVSADALADIAATVDPAVKGDFPEPGSTA